MIHQGRFVLKKTKSETLVVANWKGGLPSLPGGQKWKRGGFKCLEVYLGKNVEPKPSFTGHVLQLVVSMSRKVVLDILAIDFLLLDAPECFVFVKRRGTTWPGTCPEQNGNIETAVYTNEPHRSKRFVMERCDKLHFKKRKFTSLAFKRASHQQSQTGHWGHHYIRSHQDAVFQWNPHSEGSRAVPGPSDKLTVALHLRPKFVQ